MKRKIIIGGLVVIIIDQLVKLLITSTMVVNQSIPIIRKFFNITYVQNEGAAWNIFSGSRWFLIIISILALYAIIKYFLLDKHITKIEFVGYSLILGGIVGNLIDRLVRTYVVDYFDFFSPEYNFPIFNIADTAIVTGSILIIYSLIRGIKK